MPSLLGDDRDGVGIPLGELLALGHHRAFVGEQLRAVGHAVARLLAARLVEQHQLAVAAHHDRDARRVDDDVAVLDPHLGVERRLDRGLLGAALHRAADVEGAHGELGARLADRLRGDDADRLADIDHGAAREIAAIALAAEPDLRSRRSAPSGSARYRCRPGRCSSTASSSMSSPALTMTLPFSGSTTSTAAVRPRMRSAKRRDHLAAFDHGAHGEAARACRNPPR